MNITNLHLRFSGLYRKFDFIDTRWVRMTISVNLVKLRILSDVFKKGALFNSIFLGRANPYVLEYES